MQRGVMPVIGTPSSLEKYDRPCFGVPIHGKT